MSTPDAPVVVVGAGLAGSAAAWALSRRGVPVVVLDRFAAGHDRGSSHGSARIVRRAYGDALYTRLTGEAFELWRELELESGVSILRELGGLDFGARRDVPAVAEHLADCGVAHEVLPAGEAALRWPGMAFDSDVVFHPQAGTMDAAGAVGAFLAGASARGAVVRLATPAAAVSGRRVSLDDGSVIDARCVVVAAGAWVEPLLAASPDGRAVPLPELRVTQQQIFHFPRLDPTAVPWPSVIHEPDGHAVYHLAGGRDGGPGDDRKVGEHDAGGATTADGRDGAVDPVARARAVEYVQRYLPGLDPTPRSEATCLYTSTPSEDFVVDRIGDLVVVSPCSGHGAKFAPLTGEWVARLVEGAGEVPDRFRLAAHAAGLGGAVSL
jgi:glycine/D-amino acid oxidase-like deaminating enzyme